MPPEEAVGRGEEREARDLVGDADEVRDLRERIGRLAGATAALGPAATGVGAEVQGAGDHSDIAFQSWHDLPLEGPVTTLHLARHYERHDGDPRQWLQMWARDKHLDSNLRVVHEFHVLMKVILFPGVYDQLHLGAIVCLEVVA